MIKTKSIFDHIDPSDGTRICVMRFVKSSYGYDEWLNDLAPSSGLLREYQSKELGWPDFTKRYLAEMASQKELIASLKKRSDSGETITLLCWEPTERFCHRRLLKDLILGS